MRRVAGLEAVNSLVLLVEAIETILPKLSSAVLLATIAIWIDCSLLFGYLNCRIWWCWYELYIFDSIRWVRWVAKKARLCHFRCIFFIFFEFDNNIIYPHLGRRHYLNHYFRKFPKGTLWISCRYMYYDFCLICRKKKFWNSFPRICGQILVPYFRKNVILDKIWDSM